jgi:hypothetical protein
MLKDVETQNRLALEALEQAKAIDAILSDPDKAATLGESRQILISVKERFLSLSRSLSSNATMTSSSVSAVLTKVSAAS